MLHERRLGGLDVLLILVAHDAPSSRFLARGFGRFALGCGTVLAGTVLAGTVLARLRRFFARGLGLAWAQAAPAGGRFGRRGRRLGGFGIIRGLSTVRA